MKRRDLMRLAGKGVIDSESNENKSCRTQMEYRQKM